MQYRLTYSIMILARGREPRKKPRQGIRKDENRMKLETLKKNLENKGLTVEWIRLQFGDENRQGLRVDHDYSGLYPDAETFRAHGLADQAARKAGYKAEPRGYYSATFIY